MTHPAEAKFALAAPACRLAREGMAQEIRANLVVPSLVDTPLGRGGPPGSTRAGPRGSLLFGPQAAATQR